jgi:hypothetical protein
MLPEINTQLTNKVRQPEAHSFHSPGRPSTGQAGNLQFGKFFDIFAYLYLCQYP